VDDKHDVADSQAELLLILGYEAWACYDGRSAILQAEALHPDICLIDLNMPGMDGDEVGIQLRAAGRPLKLLAITASSDDEASYRIKAAGFDRHLVKPVDPALLIGILRRFAETVSRDGQVRFDDQSQAGLVPMCAWCRKVYVDGGWRHIASDDRVHLTHGICPDCLYEVMKNEAPCAK